MKHSRGLFALPLLLAVAALSACAAGTDDPAKSPDEGSADDLTSVTARSRELRFESVLYVADGASDATIVRAAQEQTRTAFGALQHAEIAVNDRELRSIDPASFVKRQIRVVSADSGEAERSMTEVRYTYVDDAVVPVAMARRSSIPSAVLAQGTSYQGAKVVEECTANDQHSRDYPNWYEFDPTLSSCRSAIQKEQKAIDDAQKALGAGVEGETPRVAAAAIARVYVPITVKLGADKTNKGKSYPEYQRLFAGGVEQNKLVFGFMYGLIDDNPATPADDYNFGEWMTHLDFVFKARPGMKLVSSDPAVDLSPVTLPSGLVVSDISFEKMMQWKLQRSGYPEGISYAEKGTLLNEVSKRFYQSFLSFEAPVTVQDDAGERAFTVKVLTYLGVESSSGPHKRMIKNSDVYLYNGHSYIGSGPLDPGNFRQGDFPDSYQILFIDGCVSYNYYEKDYFPLKAGGTQNLDIVTNGLEAPSYRSGYALGKFSAALVDGSFPSYRQLLEAAASTDPLRVVDGELDNEYTPKKYDLSLR